MKIVNIANMLAKEHPIFELDGVFFDVLAHPARSGIWIVYGNEKNGKTWFALLLAKYLADSQKEKVLYISAEEGTGKAFTESVKRAGIGSGSNVKFTQYADITEVREYLARRGAAKIIFIDNITVYNDELKNGELRKLQRDFPQVLFVFLAHEDKKEPYGATAKLAKKLAEIIIRVVGLRADVSGRCPGGVLFVDEEKAALFHGTV